jgi:dolichol-phosphate mannosyltransferase
VAAVSWNFLLTDTLLFRTRRAGSRWRRYVAYAAFNSLDILLRLPAMALLVGVLAVPTLWATAASIAAMSLLRFVAVDRVLYKVAPGHTPAAPAPAHRAVLDAA